MFFFVVVEENVMMKDEVTTPCDSAHAPQTDLVQKLQEEFAGIALDPSSNGSDVCECDTANAPMPITAIPTERPENMILFGGAITCSFPRRYTVKSSTLYFLGFMFCDSFVSDFFVFVT